MYVGMYVYLYVSCIRQALRPEKRCGLLVKERRLVLLSAEHSLGTSEVQFAYIQAFVYIDGVVCLRNGGGVRAWGCAWPCCGVLPPGEGWAKGNPRGATNDDCGDKLLTHVLAVLYGFSFGEGATRGVSDHDRIGRDVWL